MNRWWALASAPVNVKLGVQEPFFSHVLTGRRRLMDNREESKDQRTIKSKKDDRSAQRRAFPVFSRRSSFGPGLRADVVKHNGSALGRILRKWGELTFNPWPNASSYTKKTAQTTTNEMGSRPRRLSPGSGEHLLIQLCPPSP